MDEFGTENQDALQIALDHLKQDEGFVAVPKKDPIGKMSGGYGRNFEANPITEKEATQWAQDKLNYEIMCLQHDQLYKKLTIIRRAIILEMAYQVGVGGMLAFKDMWNYIEKDDMSHAADEIINSDVARKYPVRWRKHWYRFKHNTLSLPDHLVQEI